MTRFGERAGGYTQFICEPSDWFVDESSMRERGRPRKPSLEQSSIAF
jgi:hypothetical protein